MGQRGDSIRHSKLATDGAGISTRWLVAAAVPAIAVVAFGAGQWALALPDLCLHKVLTGLPCGGCGMTRAFVAMARGDVPTALASQPLAPLVAVGLGWWWLSAISGDKVTFAPPRWSLWAVLAAFCVLHIGRQFGMWWPPAT